MFQHGNKCLVSGEDQTGTKVVNWGIVCPSHRPLIVSRYFLLTVLILTQGRVNLYNQEPKRRVLV